MSSPLERSLKRLAELTAHLPPFSNPAGSGFVEYVVDHGVCLGINLDGDRPESALQRAFMNKGAFFPMHPHECTEWLIVIDGEIVVTKLDKAPVTLCKGHGVCILPGEAHSVEATKNTWMYGITIPREDGYPR